MVPLVWGIPHFELRTRGLGFTVEDLSFRVQGLVLLKAWLPGLVVRF